MDNRYTPASALWEFAREQPHLFQYEALRTLKRLGERFPPKISLASQSLSPVGLKRCSQWPDYLHPAALLPGIAVATNNCSYPDCFEIQPNCVGEDLFVMMLAVSNESMEQKQLTGGATPWKWARQQVGGRLRDWVRKWPNQTAVAIVTSDSARLLHDSLQSRWAASSILVTYQGSSNWMQVWGAHSFTDGMARAAGASEPKASYQGGCQMTSASKADGQRTYYYPSSWPQDVVMQHGSSYNHTRWRGTRFRFRLAVFVGSKTHCTRDELFRLQSELEQMAFMSSKV